MRPKSGVIPGFWGVLMIAALTGGCSPFSPVRAHRENVYVLQAEVKPMARRQQSPLTLVVSPPLAEPGYDGSRMVYIREPYRIEYYAWSRWAATPGQMVAPLLVRAIDQRGGFRSVVQGPSATRTDLRLDTELVRLQQEFLERPSRVRLTLRAQLVEVASRQVIATRVFDVVEAAPSEDPYGGVVAANRALKRVLEGVADFCASEAQLMPARQGQGD